MSGERNQNTDFLEQYGSRERQEKQQELQHRIKLLQEYQQSQQEARQEMQALKQEMLPVVSLTELEQKVATLDLKNQENFVSQVKKIEEQLQVLEQSRDDLRTLASGIKSAYPKAYMSKVYPMIQQQMPDHSPSANQGRAESYLRIANIAPQEGENPIANRLAKRIQQLVS